MLLLFNRQRNVGSKMLLYFDQIFLSIYCTCTLFCMMISLGCGINDHLASHIAEEKTLRAINVPIHLEKQVVCLELISH